MAFDAIIAAGLVIAVNARLRDDYYLFALGVLAAIAAIFGVSRATRRPKRLRAHVMAMGGSYILLLTAFYVDNGKNLPLWNRLSFRQRTTWRRRGERHERSMDRAGWRGGNTQCDSELHI